MLIVRAIERYFTYRQTWGGTGVEGRERKLEGAVVKPPVAEPPEKLLMK
jgi:hypothetical protein